MKTQRHTAAEIAAKLEEADALIANGKLHGDIAKALGVSIMTYHRWRKARESDASPIEQTSRINELQLENSRLRRIVTDLLLEKMNLEEGIGSRMLDVKRGAWR